ncbi:MAG: adenine deaminase C-terminal domain-containing protein, partial [Ferruginibacter sp.]
ETIPVIEALDGQLITHRIDVPPVVLNGQIIADPTSDRLKIVVVNRYHQAPVAVSFIHHIGIKGGALASSVAHDSHNIVAVGADDDAIAKAVQLIMDHRGGLSAVFEQEAHILPLPVAGLMSDLDGEVVAERYTHLDAFVKQTMGSPLRAPFMTLSFMALLVIPQLKLSDRGLFDGDTFSWVDGWQIG